MQVQSEQSLIEQRSFVLPFSAGNIIEPLPFTPKTTFFKSLFDTLLSSKFLCRKILDLIDTLKRITGNMKKNQNQFCGRISLILCTTVNDINNICINYPVL